MNETQLIKSRSDILMSWAAKLLVIMVWASAMIFGLYILVFYFLSLLQGNADQWNDILPGLYDNETKTATISIGIHFAAGGIILILGSIQLIDSLRIKYPSIHRYVGRLYVLASLAAGFGGLFFILLKGTIGGFIMDVGFGGYGVLTVGAALATIYYARLGLFNKHRAWAIRLYALAIGSWLYRMTYGFWYLCTGGIGHTIDFTGPFDYVMDFFFYIPNLIVAEICIGNYNFTKNSIAKTVAICGLFIASTFIILATFFYTKFGWGPPILEALGIECWWCEESGIPN